MRNIFKTITRRVFLCTQNTFRVSNNTCLPIISHRNLYTSSFYRTVSDSKSLAPNKNLNETLKEEDTKTEVLKNNEENLAENEVLSEEEQKRLKVIQLEYQVFASTGVEVPEEMRDKDWMSLLKHCPSSYSRKKYYKYLFKTEKSKQNEKKKKEANILKQEEKRKVIKEKIERGELPPFINTYLMYVQERTMTHHYYNNLFRAMVEGPHLVFDMSYEHEQTQREMKNLVKQIYISYGCNKVHRSPFHFHFCNLDPSTFLITSFKNTFSNIDNAPFTLSQDSYLQHYPKDQLVYLSPNATEVMTTYDEEKTYIIGGIVDRAEELPLTSTKAFKEGIRCQKLPIDQYVKWTQGSKSLTLNQVVELLLSVRNNGSWLESLERYLPKRKFMKVDEHMAKEEEMKKMRKMKRKWAVFDNGAQKGFKKFGRNNNDEDFNHKYKNNKKFDNYVGLVKDKGK